MESLLKSESFTFSKSKYRLCNDRNNEEKNDFKLMYCEMFQTKPKWQQYTICVSLKSKGIAVEISEHIKT